MGQISKFVYQVIDVGAICLSYVFSYLARYGNLNDFDKLTNSWFYLFFTVVFYFLVNVWGQSEEQFMTRTWTEEISYIIRYNCYLGFFFASILFITKNGANVSRILMGLVLIYNCLLMYLFRMTFKKYLLRYYQKPENKKKLLLIVNQENLDSVLNNMEVKLLDYKVHKCLVLTTKREAEATPDVTNMHIYVNSFDEALQFVRQEVIDTAFISLPEYGKEELSDIVGKLEMMGISVHLAIDSFGISKKEKSVGDFSGYHVLTYAPRVFNDMELLLKRGIDIAGGIVGILITIVLGIFVVPAIYLESPGPIVFKQARIGTNGRRFHIFKFRSMYPDAEERLKDLMNRNEMSDNLMFKMKNDPRITKVGRFIRETSIDELPQFFNVLRGEMSLVGTRPPTVKEFLHYEERHKRRLSLKPGITGLWQVSGRSGITEFEEVVKLDLHYIDNWSLWLDVRIICRTLVVVLFRRGAI